MLNADIFQITPSDVSNLIGETSRFVMHVILMHICSVIIVKKDDLFGTPLYQTIIMTILAIILYHLFFRKTIEPYLEKMKSSYAVEVDIESVLNKDNDGKEKNTQTSLGTSTDPTIGPTIRPTTKTTRPTIRPTTRPTTRPTAKTPGPIRPTRQTMAIRPIRASRPPRPPRS